MIVSAAITSAALGQTSETVTFESADGATVFAEVYLAEGGKQAPVILLFHQGGSNGRGEYGDLIAPHLVSSGFNVIAPDARAGGELYGHTNRTADGIGAGGDRRGYLEAYPDIVATLEYTIAQGFNGPRFVWGSSYSGAIALKLGIERSDDLAGVLGFSPASGEVMGEWAAYQFAGDVEIPTFLAWPQSEWEREMVIRTRGEAVSAGHEVHLQPQGVHGSSMLHPERCEGGTTELGQKVIEFIRRHSDE